MSYTQEMARILAVLALCIGLGVVMGESPQRVVPTVRVEDPALVTEVIRLRALVEARKSQAGMPQKKDVNDQSTCAAKNCSMAQHGDMPLQPNKSPPSTQIGAEVLRLRDMAAPPSRQGVKRPITRDKSFVDTPKRFVVSRSTHMFNETLLQGTCKDRSLSRIL